MAFTMHQTIYCLTVAVCLWIALDGTIAQTTEGKDSATLDKLLSSVQDLHEALVRHRSKLIAATTVKPVIEANPLSYVLNRRSQHQGYRHSSTSTAPVEAIPTLAPVQPLLESPPPPAHIEDWSQVLSSTPAPEKRKYEGPDKKKLINVPCNEGQGRDGTCRTNFGS